MKNEEKRIPEDKLGLVVYGRNVLGKDGSARIMRDVLKTSRT
jgi:hypothetical protein